MKIEKMFDAGFGGAELSEEALAAATGGTGDDEAMKYVASHICDDMEQQVSCLNCEEWIRGMFYSMIENCRAMIAACNWGMARALCDGLAGMITEDLFEQEAGNRLMCDVHDLWCQLGSR